MRIKNQKGQGMIEYLILVALMAVATIGIARVLNQTVNAKFTEITYALRGDKKPIEKERISKELYQTRDMQTFLNGVTKEKKK